MDPKKMEQSKRKFYFNTPEEYFKRQRLLDSLSAEMILEKSIRDFRKERILREIDESLEKKDKETFLRLTKELATLIKT